MKKREFICCSNEGRRETYPLLAALGLEGAWERKENDPFVLALVGGGGKTTVMAALAREVSAAGRRVLVETSTHIGMPKTGKVLVYRADGDVLELWEGKGDGDGFSVRSLPETAWKRETVQIWDGVGGILTVGTLEEKGGVRKLTALPEKIRRELALAADLILTEADGAKRHPVKIPASHEPVIRSETDGVLGCIGLSAIGRPAGEVLFRRELLGISPEEPVTEELAVKILSSEEGTKKYTAGRLYRAVLNQCDTEERLERARRMGAGLKQRGVHGAALSWGKAVWIF